MSNQANVLQAVRNIAIRGVELGNSSSRIEDQGMGVVYLGQTILARSWQRTLSGMHAVCRLAYQTLLN